MELFEKRLASVDVHEFEGNFKVEQFKSLTFTDVLITTGLKHPSMIPEDSQKQLRLISRHRTNLVNDLARIKNRVQKTLEDGNIKWGLVASDVFGKSGVQTLRLLADGVTDVNTPSSAMTTKIKRKEGVRKLLTNCS